ncbi:unnamed protein product, partial [Discosporangium mesarthrocarpum]
QCEQCTRWYHGVCVGFDDERSVPDLWLCGPCRGTAHHVVWQGQGQ